MKESKFNYIYKDNNKYVLFNGLTCRFMEFDVVLKKKIIEILNKPDEIYEDFCDLQSVLIDNGFIVDDNANEIELIKINKFKKISEPKYTLTILPTYNCNFSCWYCIQKHKNEFMQEKTINAIKQNISQYIKDNNIEIFEIHWFGGEPLLCFEKHIREISEYALNVCNDNNVRFYNNITTNGYLINEEIANQMCDLRFKQFQITVDGDRMIHNKTRNQDGNPSFDIILNNVKTLINTIPDVKVILRFNATDRNIHRFKLMIEQMNEIFTHRYRSSIFIFMIKVWQVQKQQIEKEYFVNINSEFSSNGYSIADVEFNSNFLNCDYEQEHSYVIFHNGNVDKCNNIDPSESHYRLTETGNFERIKEEIGVYDIFSSDSLCYNCKHLPICLGPCLKCLRFMPNKESFKCIEQISEHNNFERIQNYCRTYLSKNK